jgi:uncharacterized protein (UPF0332 family)
MNEHNKRINIESELNRANDALKAAELLAQNDLCNDAVSKLYYVLLYCVRALLLLKGIEARSHEGALRMFGLHFIREGLIEVSYSHIFSKMMKYREEADYNPHYYFTREDYAEYKKEVDEFSEMVSTYLKNAGFR